MIMQQVVYNWKLVHMVMCGSLHLQRVHISNAHTSSAEKTDADPYVLSRTRGGNTDMASEV